MGWRVKRPGVWVFFSLLPPLDLDLALMNEGDSDSARGFKRLSQKLARGGQRPRAKL